MLYYIFWPIVLLTLRFFYRPLKITGLHHLPHDGPVILAPNHQNAFLDAIIPATLQARRMLHFLARSDIFKKGLAEKVLYSFHIWPVYRLIDGKETLGKNEKIFNSCSQLLSNNGCLLIFPEGSQEVGHRLRPLKKGLARIAFQTAEQTGFEKEIHIVPVGINYESYDRYGTALQLRFGKPLKVLSYKDIYLESPQKAMQLLTTDLKDAMRAEVVHVDDREDEEFWFEKAGLTGEQLTSPEFFAQLDLKSRPVPAARRRKKLTAAVARLLHWSVLRLIQGLVAANVKGPKFVGSVKVVLGMLLIPMYYAIIILAIGLVSGSWLPALCLVALMVLLLRGS